jgi:hypothetical protein
MRKQVKNAQVRLKNNSTVISYSGLAEDSVVLFLIPYFLLKFAST